MSAEAVWSEFSGRLRAFIARRVRHPEDADDLLQEVFLRIHRSSGTLADADRLPAWLFQITRNVLIDHYRSTAARHRHTGGQREGPEEEPPADAAGAISGAADAPSPGDDARDEEELATCLVPMLERLPEPYREAVRLTGLDGVPQVVAAERLGLSASGMKSRVQRGRRLLRDLVLRCCEVDFDRRGGVASYRSRVDGEGCGEGGCGDACGTMGPGED
jgi:RNA polymerase sigma-70 factor (ECF subfamily)